jgi:hypothetical protein
MPCTFVCVPSLVAEGKESRLCSGKESEFHRACGRARAIRREDERMNHGCPWRVFSVA